MIYLIRHGETVWNVEKRKQGHKDSPLTLKGIDQIKSVGLDLVKENINFDNFELITSPLFRALQSVSIISSIIDVDYKNFKQCEEFKEHSFGKWEGLTEQEIEPKLLKEREKDRWNFIIPGGESYQLLHNRVKQGLNSHGPNLIIVTHDMVCRVIKGIFYNLNNEDILNVKNEQGVIYKLN